MRIRDVALKTCQRRWTIRRSGERGSGVAVLAARHDDDIYMYIYTVLTLKYIYIYIPYERKTFKNYSYFGNNIYFSTPYIFFMMLDLHLQTKKKFFYLSISLDFSQFHRWAIRKWISIFLTDSCLIFLYILDWFYWINFIWINFIFCCILQSY